MFAMQSECNLDRLFFVCTMMGRLITGYVFRSSCRTLCKNMLCLPTFNQNCSGPTFSHKFSGIKYDEDMFRSSEFFVMYVDWQTSLRR
jgi:hypothetical protein